MTELGYPDSNYTSHFGFFAPAKTPEAALKRLHADINAALALPDVVERLTKLDNVVAPSTQEQFAQVVRREYEANAKVVAKAGNQERVMRKLIFLLLLAVFQDGQGADISHPPGEARRRLHARAAAWTSTRAAGAQALAS